MPQPTMCFDTSAINALTDDIESDTLITAIKTSHRVRLIGTAFAEIVATSSKSRQDQLIGILRKLLGSGECLHDYAQVLEILISNPNRSTPGYSWRSVEMRAKDYETEIARCELISNELSEKQRRFGKAAEKEFTEMFKAMRKEIAPKITEDATLDDMFTALEGGAAVAGLKRTLYERFKKNPSTADIDAFYDATPPFQAIVHAMLIATFDRCVKRSDKRKAGRNDVCMSVFLPYCEKFISNDGDHVSFLKDVSRFTQLQVVVDDWKSFRGSLMIF